MNWMYPPSEINRWWKLQSSMEVINYRSIFKICNYYLLNESLLLWKRVRVEDYNLLCFMEEDEGLFLQPHLVLFPIQVSLFSFWVLVSSPMHNFFEFFFPFPPYVYKFHVWCRNLFLSVKHLVWTWVFKAAVSIYRYWQSKLKYLHDMITWITGWISKFSLGVAHQLNCWGGLSRIIHH